MKQTTEDRLVAVLEKLVALLEAGTVARPAATIEKTLPGEASGRKFLAAWKANGIDGVPYATCHCSDLYRAYRAWCDMNGEWSMTHRAFAMLRNRMGFRRRDFNSGTIVEATSYADVGPIALKKFARAVRKFEAQR